MKKRELMEAQLRADDYEVQIDFANLNVTRGDRVQLQHDVILAGLLTARIKSVTLNGSNEATVVTIDDEFTMADGTNYAMRIRLASGAQVVQQIVTVAGSYASGTFTTPIPVGSVPAVGDLVVVGILGSETLDCIVKEITPGPDFTATLKLVDYAPAIQTAETLEEAPPYTPNITFPTDVVVPSIPTVVQVVSDETVLVRDIDGSLQSQIVVSVYFSSSARTIVDRLESQFRVSGSDDDWHVIFSDIRATSVEVPLRPVEQGLSYDIRIRALDLDTGAASDWTYVINHTVVGKTSPPPDVTLLTLEGTRLRWNYPSPPRDLAGFYVRVRQGSSRDWDNAEPLHAQLITTTDFSVLIRPELQTFLVKAVDVAGNVSANPGALTINLGAIPVDNVMVTTDHRLLGWPGTITGASINSGDLVADASGTYWTNDAALAWDKAAGDTYWATAGGQMTYEFTVSPTVDLLDSTLKLTIQMLGEWKIDYNLDSSAYMWNSDTGVLMWNATSTTLMWSQEGAGVFLSAPTVIYPVRYSRYTFRITGAAGSVQAVLQQLKVQFDVPDISESFSSLALASGGTRLTLTKTYRALVIVAPTLVYDGGSAVMVRAMDKDVSAGPLVQAFDASGTGTTATVDVIVQGY